MLLALLIAASVDDSSRFMTFSRSPAFDPRTVKIEVGHLQGGEGYHYWFKRIVATKSARAVWWTDTRRCPAARSVLLAATRVEPPKIFVMGLKSDAITIVGDGVSYEVQASSEYPDKGIFDIRFNSNARTPLARWVDESLRTLEPCWRKKRPEHFPVAAS